MKRIFCLLCVLTALFLLSACKDNTPTINKYKVMKTNICKDYVPEFMELLSEDIELSGLFSGYALDEEHCYNVTPPQVAAETDMKIFKFSDSSASFVMADGKIYILCTFLGGHGFVNAIPCDFDNDGNKDLLVASSWGSGLHRSNISIFNSVTKESTVIYDNSPTAETPADLIVMSSTANISTDNPATDETLRYWVLSAEINVENDNWANLSYVATGIEGHIEIKNGAPTFIPYQK